MRSGEGKSIDEILASIMNGKTDQPEIFESLKNVASTHPSTKDLVVASKPPAPAGPPAKEEPEPQFLCPVCDTAVNPTDRVCPGCGAEFSEGEATEYECPICKAAVPADASQCPSCGVRFATEEDAEAMSEPAAPEPQAPARAAATAGSATPPVSVAPGRPKDASAFGPQVAAIRDEIRLEVRELPLGDHKLVARELPKLVNEVKPLLVTAKRVGLNIEEGKRLINGAVEAGKRKEMERAVKLIIDARRSLDLAFVDFVGSRVESLAAEVQAAASAEVANLVRPYLQAAVNQLQGRDYDRAWEAFESAKHAFQSQSKEYSERRNVLAAADRLSREVRELGMDTRDVDRFIRQSEEAAGKRDLSGSLRLAKQAQERLLTAVPVFVQEEMREARNDLLDLKMRGGDLTKPVGILKEASAHVKKEEWSEALRFLLEFRKEIARSAKA